MPAQFEQAELLKKQYTDKFVVVKPNVAELRRFSGLTGVVKTVNMSGRALVLFDGPADIGWYDIDPAYLTVVDAPLPKKAAEAKPTKEPAAKAAPVAKAAPAAGEKKASPLDMIRQQGAVGAKPAAPAPAASGEGKKLSPIEMIRQQGAKSAESAPAAASAEAVAETPKPAAPAAEGKKLSPLEMIRQQGAAKNK